MEIDAVAMVRTDRLEAVQILFAPDARRVCSTTAMTAPRSWSDSEFAGPRGIEGGVKLASLVQGGRRSTNPAPIRSFLTSCSSNGSSWIGESSYDAQFEDS
jgi:hypothetical protein